MKYFLYALDTGEVKHFCITPDAHTESFIPGLGIVSADGFSEADAAILTVVDGVPTPGEPKLVFVNSREVKAAWLRRESAPVLVGGYYLDCDPVSELRIKNTIEAWNYLPLIPGQLEEIDGVRSVLWTLADNSKQRLELPDLVAILPALVTARAVRAAVLYAAYQRLKVRTDVTLTELNSDTSWE